MGEIISTLGGLVQDVWTAASSWVPVLAAAGTGDTCIPEKRCSHGRPNNPAGRR